MIISILYFKWFQIHNFSKSFGYVPSKSIIRIYELWVWICLLGYIIYKKTTFCFGRLCCIGVLFDYIWKQFSVIVFSFLEDIIELMINKIHGLSPSGGLVSPSGGFASLFFDQVEYFASIKLCQALSRQGAIIKIPVVRCHYLLCSSAQ